jgi:hypothetical protein
MANIIVDYFTYIYISEVLLFYIKYHTMKDHGSKRIINYDKDLPFEEFAKLV